MLFSVIHNVFVIYEENVTNNQLIDYQYILFSIHGTINKK